MRDREVPNRRLAALNPEAPRGPESPSCSTARSRIAVLQHREVPNRRLGSFFFPPPRYADGADIPEAYNPVLEHSRARGPVAGAGAVPLGGASLWRVGTARNDEGVGQPTRVWEQLATVCGGNDEGVGTARPCRSGSARVWEQLAQRRGNTNSSFGGNLRVLWEQLAMRGLLRPATIFAPSPP